MDNDTAISTNEGRDVAWQGIAIVGAGVGASLWADRRAAHPAG